MNKKIDNFVIFIVGPTGSGKSAAAVEVARRIGGEVVSADSMQLYRGMDIGTAKLTVRERGGVAHHLLDIAEPRAPLDVAHYRKAAVEAIEGIFRRGKIPFVVGGSGLYVRSLTDGIFEGPACNPELRRRLAAAADEKGPQALRRELEKVDPEAAARIKGNDRRRLIRALEVYEAEKQPITRLQKQSSQKTPFDFAMFGLNLPREALYRRLNERVEKMFEAGLVEETVRLLERGLAESPVALQAIGYKETAAHLRGETTLEEAVRRVQQATRHLAKRQWTWFRRDPRVEWIELSASETVEEIAEKLYIKIMEAMSDSRHD